MNVQLYLGGQEVELNGDVSIPLNKTYENLSSPSNIIVDYSKSINIPMSKRNNEILGSAYRLDRRIVAGSNNIGYYLDPSKKIPMKLLYNQEIILDGYAKFLSASNSTGSKYYTISLFGVLGDIFQKLLSVVASSDQLQEGQSYDYVLADPTTGIKLNKEYILASWEDDQNAIGKDNVRNTDVIGFAPAHRGLYQEFESGKIQTSSTEIKDVTTYLEEIWSDSIGEEAAKNLKVGEIINGGLPDYQMREYRSYELKPYIYINQLFEMFKDNCRWLTGYEMEFDNTWFNINNPYWSRLVYMLDFLENKGTDPSILKKFTSQTTFNPTTTITNNSAYQVNYSFEEFVPQTNLDTENGVSINPFEIQIEGNYYKENTSGSLTSFGLAATTNVLIDVTLTSGGDSSTKKYWSNSAWGSLMPPEGYTTDDYMPITTAQKPNILDPSTFGGPNFKTIYKITIPQQDLTTEIVNGVTINIDVRLQHSGYGYDGSSTGVWAYVVWESGGNIFNGNFVWNQEYLVQSPPGDGNFPVTIARIDYKSSWRTSTRVQFRDIYFSDNPPFNILLQYTKMFGLIWDVDYSAKKLYIKTKQTYFKDYTIEDWSKKLDRSKDFVIEPISFTTKYANFNYEETDGYRYKGYKDKYNIEYGGKVLKTPYDFDVESTDLFENISPSSASSKTYIPFQSLKTRNFVEELDDKVLIDSENNDETSPIAIENWYLRGLNRTLPYSNIITDDTGLMVSSDEYCYIERDFAINNNLCIETTTFPTFNIALSGEGILFNDEGTVFGCLFNQPKEDYTYDKLPTKAKGNYIYDLFWNRYMDERFNIQNKKVTAHFLLTPTDFQNFSFKKFVTIDNQVFMVNKIFDYDMNNKTSVKCELVQITDPTAYTTVTKSFPTIAYSPQIVNINGSNYANDYGSFDVTFRSTPIVNNVMIQPYDNSSSEDAVTVSLTQTNLGAGEAKAHIYFQGLGATKSIWRGTLTVWSRDNKVSTTVPVTIDFSNWTGTSETPTQYTITTVEALQCTLDYTSPINEGETFICTVVPKDPIGGIVVGDCVIKMGGVTLNNSDVINTSTKTITIPNVSGNIELTVSCYSVGDGSGGGSGPIGPGDIVIRPMSVDEITTIK